MQCIVRTTAIIARIFVRRHVLPFDFQVVNSFNGIFDNFRWKFRGVFLKLRTTCIFRKFHFRRDLFPLNVHPKLSIIQLDGEHTKVGCLCQVIKRWWCVEYITLIYDYGHYFKLSLNFIASGEPVCS